jgi:hypothetical protein
MGIRTGKPRGRPQGAKNRRTVAVEEAAAQTAAQIAEAIPGAFEGDAHALLMTVYKDPTKDWPLRIDAAKAAIRYEKPALATTELKGELKLNDVAAEPEQSEAEWSQQHGHA